LIILAQCAGPHYLLEKMNLGGEGSIKKRLTATHPRITARIGRLETKLGVQVEEA